MRWGEIMSVRSAFDTMSLGPAPESPREALGWIEGRGGAFGVFTGGSFGRHDSRRAFATVNPCSGETLAMATRASAGDVDRAVRAARAAQPSWEGIGGHARARLLYALARLIQRNARLFATLESLDNGKPIRESRDIDIPLAARHFYFHAGAAQLMEAELPGHEAMGVAGQIIPWNFPLLMLAWKVAPALAMGNTVVLKPAEQTPLTALLFAEMTQIAGLPDGVVNIVTGDGDAGEMIVRHPGVDKIAFTGSTEVGRLIRRATAGSGKSLTLELGGKSPFVVFDDADLDSAVEGAVDSIWLNQGEVCCAGSRLLVQEGAAAALEAKLKARMERLRVGDSLDKCVDMGALVDGTQLERVAGMVRSAKGDGGAVHQPRGSLPKSGCYYPPTLITGLAPSSPLMREEIFGPVLVAATFRTPSEAVALANNSRYGLAASVWTESASLALDMARRISAGVVWVNCANMFDAASGFGGRRESGFGREGGWEGLLAYARPKMRRRALPRPPAPAPGAPPGPGADLIDRTAKMYIGGKQARPDGGYSRPVYGHRGNRAGDVGEGNRKDIRNAVEAARRASSWASSPGHLRAQILYYVAENLAARREEFASRIRDLAGGTGAAAEEEVELSVRRLFTYAAWSDKLDGRVHDALARGVVMAVNEPAGVIGAFCPDRFPLLGLVSLLGPCMSMGNASVLVPSEPHPLVATDFYQVLETSDVPAGVVNIVTGSHGELARALSGHMDVDSVWYFGSGGHSGLVEEASVSNLKRTWVNNGLDRDWRSASEGEGREFLAHATDVKNIWIPHGE